jgi:hypothetical protein
VTHPQLPHCEEFQVMRHQHACSRLSPWEPPPRSPTNAFRRCGGDGGPRSPPPVACSDQHIIIYGIDGQAQLRANAAAACSGPLRPRRMVAPRADAGALARAGGASHTRIRSRQCQQRCAAGGSPPPERPQAALVTLFTAFGRRKLAPWRTVPATSPGSGSCASGPPADSDEDAAVET